MKNIGKLAVLGAVLAASASFAFADTITLGSYGTGSSITGVDTNSALVYGGYAANPSAPTWAANPSSFISSGASPSTTYNLAPGGWAGPLSNSYWVGSNANQGNGGNFTPVNGYYTYTSTFSISPTGGGLYDISMNLLADDTMAVYLNGVLEVPAGFIGYDQDCSDNVPNCTTVDPAFFTASLAGGSVDTLTFVDEQTGGASAGVDFNGSAYIPSAPEPNSLMLLGTGLIGAAGMFYRRRVAA